MHSFLRCILMILALGLNLGGASSANAQTSNTHAAIALPDPLTPDAVNALVSRLTDEQVRALLLERLNRMAHVQIASASDAGPTSAVGLFSDAAARSRDVFVRALGSAPNVFALQAWALADYARSLSFKGFARFASIFLLATGIGLLIEYLLGRFGVFRRRRFWADVQGRPIFEVVPYLAWRLLRNLAGVLIFNICASLVLHYAMSAENDPFAQIILRNLIVMPRMAAVVLRFFLAPREADERLVNSDDWTARFLFRNLLGIVFAIGATLTLLAFNDLLGVHLRNVGIGFWINLLIFCWLVWIFWTARSGLRQMVLHRNIEHTPFEVTLAQYYPAFAVAAIVVTWFLSFIASALGQGVLLRGGRHLISLAILVVAPLLDVLIRAVVSRFQPPMRGDGPTAQKAYEATFHAYVRIGRVLVFGAVVLAIARLWDMTPLTLASAGEGERVGWHLTSALLICVVGYICWEVVRLLINRKLANEMTATDDKPVSDEHAGHSAAPPVSRMGTILPPVSWTLQGIVIVVTVLTALKDIGIDVTTLLAGAGIAGIAIGFGAQKLVSDIVSGLFFLVDDAFRLNEYIDVGGTMGTVERISLRSIRLRDPKGPILIVPYSGIKSVSNFSRDWGILKLKFTVPFDTDLEQVRRIFKKIGQEMMEMPELASGFIEPFKSQGAAEFTDHGIVVRGKFSFKPGEQWAIRKHIFKRVQEEFAANGIEFARREVIVRVTGQTESLTSDELKTVTGAATEAVLDQEKGSAAT